MKIGTNDTGTIPLIMNSRSSCKHGFHWGIEHDADPRGGISKDGTLLTALFATDRSLCCQVRIFFPEIAYNEFKRFLRCLSKAE
jgi:hypothetical protein